MLLHAKQALQLAGPSLGLQDSLTGKVLKFLKDEDYFYNLPNLYHWSTSKGLRSLKNFIGIKNSLGV